MGWRDVLPVHPAADLFPMMSRDELLALGEDIKEGGAGGLRMPITLVKWAKSPVKVGPHACRPARRSQSSRCP